MEMEREKYIEELQKVLLFREEQTNKYNFDISKGGENVDCLNLSYEKNLKDVSVSRIALFSHISNRVHA